MSWIKVFAPATIANIGPGFDILGMAIKGAGDIIKARKTDSGVVITQIESTGDIPSDPNKNTAGIAAQEVLKIIGESGGLELRIKKGLPIGSGLGSSAVSAAAGAFAANYLYGKKLSKEKLIIPATLAESKVSAFHADNTASTLLGGVVLVRSVSPLDVVQLGTIDDLTLIVVTPNIVVLTKTAREVLPQKVDFSAFVQNLGNASAVTASFITNDYNLFARSLSDIIVEPVRAPLIQGFQQVKEAALSSGADGVGISGSGPTLFAITNRSGNTAAQIEKAMVSGFKEAGIAASSFITTVDEEGVRILE